MVQRSGVLIETYWNVKKRALSADQLPQLVLIETYWNVKFMYCVIISRTTFCINRNILECKEKRRGVCVTHTGGINRNILECKVRLREIVSTRRSGINRNILECKGLSPPAVRHTAVRY